MSSIDHITLAGHRVHIRIDGTEGAPWLTFCNSLGTDLTMWDPQVHALSSRFRILRYDRRGHGRSATPPGAWSLADLGQDVLALWDALGITRSHYCGLSIGGLTAQWLAVHAPDRLLRVAACATAARIGTADSWATRITQVQAHGLSSLVDGTRARWFSPAFSQAHQACVDQVLATFAATPPAGYIGCCQALAQADLRTQLDSIQVPLLALAGADDPVCPPADLQTLANTTAQGHYAAVPGRHLCNLESADAFNTTLQRFLLS